MASIREDYRSFETVIPQDQQIARAAEWSDDPRALEVKYGARTRDLRALAQEVVDLCDTSSAALQGV
jgi:cellulose biosynthesis protein BcsQ